VVIGAQKGFFRSFDIAGELAERAVFAMCGATETAKRSISPAVSKVRKNPFCAPITSCRGNNQNDARLQGEGRLVQALQGLVGALAADAGVDDLRLDLLLPQFGLQQSGETPSVKLLSQLVGDRLLIANATGCSSISSGNLPTTPWAVNPEGRGPTWSNSLFEDNAEFGLGFRLSLDSLGQQARALLAQLAGQVGEALLRDHRHALLVGVQELLARGVEAPG
jgi:hypothetical protein